jgi:hypothetical protein
MTVQALNTEDPQSVLPDQYYSGEVRIPGLDGERRLMLAVLEDAVLICQRNALTRSPEKRQEFKEAREWIEDDDTVWPFSFENICSVLGIDAEYVRAGLRSRGRASSSRRRSLDPIAPRIVPLSARGVESCSDNRQDDDSLKIAS